MTTTGGDPIAMSTKLSEIAVSNETLAQVIVFNQVDSGLLDTALAAINISATDNLNKNLQLKTMSLVNDEETRIQDICGIMKQEHKTGFTTMFLAYCTNMAKALTVTSTPVKSSSAQDEILALLLANMQMQTKTLEAFNNGLNHGFATTPKNPPPTYNYKQADMSMIKFVESKYRRWHFEEKLQEADFARRLFVAFLRGWYKKRNLRLWRSRST